LEANQTRINPTVVEAKKRGPARRLLRGFTLRLPTPRRGLVSFFACALSLSLFCAGSSLANVSITAASGGTNISADKAADATSPGWVTLGSFVLNEGNKTDISAGSGQTLILKAPAGFQFNTSALPNISFTAGDISAASIAVTDPATLTITLTIGGISSIDHLTVGNTNHIEVRPTTGTNLASGQIYRPTTGGGSATINGLTASSNTNGLGGSNFGSLSEVAGSVSQLTFATQPGNATTGAIFGSQPTIKTQDQFGNNSSNGLPASLNVTLTLTSGTGPLLGTLALNIGTSAGNGTVTYTNLELDVPGTNDQLTASAIGLAGDISAVFAVNGRPTISSISDQITPEDHPAGPIAFTIGDFETPANALAVTASSSNTNLIPVTNIVFSGSSSNRSVTVTPITNLFGTATITISVSDGTASANTSFVVTITSANDPPTMDVLTNRTILEGAGTQTVNLTGITPGPANESAQTNTITASSSNPSLIPNPTVNYTNPSASGTLTFAPAAKQFGSAIITVVIKDNGGTTNGGIDSLTNSFTVTVQPGPAPQLAIATIATNVVLSWSNSYGCYTLQSAPILSSNSWSNFSGPFATNAGIISATNISNGTLFFRLIH